MKFSERTQAWADSLAANLEGRTGRSLEAWVALARGRGITDERQLREWLRTEHELGINTIAFIRRALFPDPERGDEELIAAQYAGAKEHLRPVFDALAAAAESIADDVQVLARRSQVTFSRDVSFAVVRAATRDRVDVALKLPGVAPTERLVAARNPQGSDPTHVVGVRSVDEVDDDLAGWLEQAAARAVR